MSLSFPTADFPAIFHPYAVFYSGKRPPSYPEEVAKRLGMYERLPILRRGCDDKTLRGEFDVGIYTLSRIHLLKGIQIRLAELQNEIRAGGSKKKLMGLLRQIRVVDDEISNNKERTQRTPRYIGGCPGYSPNGDLDYSSRSCELGNDSCEI